MGLVKEYLITKMEEKGLDPEVIMEDDNLFKNFMNELSSEFTEEEMYADYLSKQDKENPTN